MSDLLSPLSWWHLYQTLYLIKIVRSYFFESKFISFIPSWNGSVSEITSFFLSWTLSNHCQMLHCTVLGRFSEMCAKSQNRKKRHPTTPILEYLSLHPYQEWSVSWHQQLDSIRELKNILQNRNKERSEKGARERVGRIRRRERTRDDKRRHKDKVLFQSSAGQDGKEG